MVKEAPAKYRAQSVHRNDAFQGGVRGEREKGQEDDHQLNVRTLCADCTKNAQYCTRLNRLKRIILSLQNK